MSGRRTLVGVIVVIFGMAATPAVSYSAGAKQRQAQCAAKSCKSKAKKKCKKGQVRKNGKCVKTKTSSSSTTPSSFKPPTSTSEALPATLIVHVYQTGDSGTEADEGAPLYISDVGEGRFVGKLETSEHTVHVRPSRYEITALSMTNPTTVALASTIVTVSAGQTLELTLTIG